MARKPRVHFKGAVYHVVLRGVDDGPIFKSVKDRRQWEALVAEGCQRFGHKIHGYAWLKDRAHFVIEVGDAPLSKIMQNLSFRYTRYFNKAHDRNGPLFHGRYKAILIDPDKYLAELVRYIHVEPLRAGTTKKIDDFKWSGHLAYLGEQETPWLTTERVLGGMAKTTKTAIKRYTAFFKDGLKEEYRQDLMQGNEGGRLLGDEDFIKKALKPVKKAPKPATLPQLVKLVCAEEKIKEAELKNESRARRESRIRQIITYLAVELEIGTLTDLAKRFNRDLTTMSRNQRYFREKLAEDAELSKKVKAYRSKLVKS
ncbi:transposase [Granulosicoccaceae sp. 1_MG-2023]|nr:transposase [Granulosicoccaceae sp. 1_MG-2023]